MERKESAEFHNVIFAMKMRFDENDKTKRLMKLVL